MNNCCIYLPNPICVTDPCNSTGSDKLVYKGPNLPCTGINNLDTLSTALQKIETKMCQIIESLE